MGVAGRSSSGRRRVGWLGSEGGLVGRQSKSKENVCMCELGVDATIALSDDLPFAILLGGGGAARSRTRREPPPPHGPGGAPVCRFGVAGKFAGERALLSSLVSFVLKPMGPSSSSPFGPPPLLRRNRTPRLRRAALGPNRSIPWRLVRCLRDSKQQRPRRCCWGLFMTGRCPRHTRIIIACFDRSFQPPPPHHPRSHPPDTSIHRPRSLPRRACGMHPNPTPRFIEGSERSRSWRSPRTGPNHFGRSERPLLGRGGRERAFPRALRPLPLPSTAGAAPGAARGLIARSVPLAGRGRAVRLRVWTAGVVAPLSLLACCGSGRPARTSSRTSSLFFAPRPGPQSCKAHDWGRRRQH